LLSSNALRFGAWRVKFRCGADFLQPAKIGSHWNNETLMVTLRVAETVFVSPVVPLM